MPVAVTVARVVPGSPAAGKDVRAGDTLLRVNGHEIEDVLDYRFYIQDEKLLLTFSRGGKIRLVSLSGERETGLEFETYLMDRQHTCRNRCIFCFIDQLPKGMRESLYFKDDDSRLSFLFGNYITLTNLSEREVRRMIAMHISPVNVSVHTTDPDLRCRMMGNRHAGEALTVLPRLAEAGLEINCQLVLCPGINDGQALDKTLRDLIALRPALRSVAAVPVGLTKYREGLFPLRPFTAEEAQAVIEKIERLGDTLRETGGERVVYPSDEFYLLCGKPLPPPSFYGEYPQLDNGVGMLTLLREEFLDALERAKPGRCYTGRTVMATGYAAYGLLCELTEAATRRFPDLCARVVRVKNEFFGEQITVAGLLTGQDLLRSLRGEDADRVLITRSMLRAGEDVFLDDMTLGDLSRELGIPVVPVAPDGAQLLRALIRS